MWRMHALPLSLLVVALLISGCGDNEAPAPIRSTEPVAPQETTVTDGPVTVMLKADPGSVLLDRNIVFTIRVTAPKHVKVQLPPIGDRLQGFIGAGQFDRKPQTDGARVTTERVIRLTPLIADEYRIAPMPIPYNAPTAANGKATNTWLATPPIVLPMQAVTDKQVDKNITPVLDPIWIHPPMQTVAGYIGILLAILAMLFLAWKLIRRAHRRIRLMRMSPRERALEELDTLLAKKLLEKQKVKDFYVELTMVVRRYIERQHHVRAPEQTTKEFLAAVSADARFAPEIVTRLRAFLEAADLVKFAAYTPDEANVTNAIDTARNYITTDADNTEAIEGVATITEHKDQLL